MSIDFERPWLLLLLIPLTAMAAIPYFLSLKKHKIRRRHTVSFVLRLISLLLAVLMISGFTAARTSDKNAVIVVADLSDSTRSVTEELRAAVKAAAEYADRKTEVGLLTFGYNSFYEIPVSTEPVFENFETDPDGNYTDIYSALIKASAMFPNGYSKRIVLLTDGKENVGKVAEAANVLIQKDIRLDAIVYDTGNTEKEVQITDISTPDTVYTGEDFNITVVIESSSDCTATLSLYCDSMLALNEEVKLSSGTNRFVFRDTAEASGISTYSAEITTDSDSLGKNNKIYTFIKIFGTPKILIVDGTGSEAHELEKIIGDSADIKTVTPSNVPNDITELRKYNAVILMNTAKSTLPDNWDSLLDVYVRQLGRGLFTTGGSRSYAVGGWSDTLLEDILPISMSVNDEVALCDMAVMLVIDNSGSMGSGAGSPLELAKQGAINACETVKDIDEVGVIAFSDNAVWVSKLTPGTDKKTVQGKIASISEGGGTMIYTALANAYAALKESDKAMKGIVLLTDGEPADGDRLFTDGLITQMAEDGIAVTSIGVGDYIDGSLLSRISSETGGSYTVCRNTSELPEIIYSETAKLLENAYINNVTFTPTVCDYTSVLSGVSALPELDGYIMTSKKDLAYCVLEAEEEHPLLSSWQYGLGKVASLTTDLNGKWSSKLLASENGRQLIMNVISYILPADEDAETGSLTLTREGDKGIVKAISPDKDNTYKTTALIISPSGKERKVELVQSGIGEYSGEFLLDEEGGYVAVVTQKDDSGNSIMYKESALAVKYSDEYDMFITDTGAVAAACIRTGGKGDWKDISLIFKEKAETVRESLQFTTPFLIIIIVFTMADIAFRRLDISLIFKRKATESKAPVTAGGETVPAADAVKAGKKSGGRKKRSEDSGPAADNSPAPEKTKADVNMPSYRPYAAEPANKNTKKAKDTPAEPETKKPAGSTVSSLLQQKNNRDKKL